MQGTASALMQAFKNAFAGTDWDLIPYGMYVYGGAGVSGWGSLCGVPNAAIAVLNLIGLHGALGSDVMGYCSTTPFPTSALPDLYYADDGYGPSDYTYPKTPIPNDQVLAHTASHSPLCHVAVSKFLYEAGISQTTVGPTGYGHRPDRCAKLVGDLAAYTAERINEYALNGSIADPYAVSEATASCMTCHVGGNTDHGPAINGMMDCSECHTPGSFHTTGDFFIDDLWTEDGSGNPKSTFAPNDTIVYKLRFAIVGAGAFFVRTKPGTTGSIIKITPSGTTKQAFNKSEECMSTVTIWSWSSTVPSNATQKGKFVVNLQVADTPTGPLLIEKNREVYFNVS
jgi:hypothetical protein